MGLYKIDKAILSAGKYVECDDLPMVSPLKIHPVEDVKYEVGEGEFESQDNLFSIIGKMARAGWDSTVGTMYFNLSDRLGKSLYAANFFTVGHEIG